MEGDFQQLPPLLCAGTMELPLLCFLVAFAGVIPAQGGILNLNKMIKQVTGKVPFFSYWPYGCHCGIGGRGEPKDATDWCCHAHDCCYSHLKGHGCRTHLDHYRYTFSQGTVQCCECPGPRGWRWKPRKRVLAWLAFFTCCVTKHSLHDLSVFLMCPVTVAELWGGVGMGVDIRRGPMESLSPSGSRRLADSAQIPDQLPLTSCVTLNTLLNCSEPQDP
uniref:Phospholipase A2 n=1 Tax=Sus scrofa TaxID=9823 RepID=A0A8D1TS04_PIG